MIQATQASTPTQWRTWQDNYDEHSRLVLNAEKRAHIFGSYAYAIALLERDVSGDRERAAAIVTALLAGQELGPQSLQYGQLPLSTSGGLSDLNAASFLMGRLVRLEELAGRLPDALAGRVHEAVTAAIVAVERRWDTEVFDLHRDFVAYTNIFLLSAEALMCAAIHHHDGRLKARTRAQWTRWFHHASYYGFDEFVSPTYCDIDWDALLLLRQSCGDDEDGQTWQREIDAALDHLSALLHAVTHPHLQLTICGASRDYRGMLSPGDKTTRAVRRDSSAPDGDYRTPENVAREFRERTFPHEARGRAGRTPFRFCSYQTERAGLGSMTGGNYFWQQIHLMVAAGNGPDERETLLLPGRYTPTAGFVCQRQNTALCLFHRGPHTLHRTQWRTPDNQVRDTLGEYGIGFTSGWQIERIAEGWRFAAYGHEVWVQPFVLDRPTLQVQEATLTRAHRDKLGQARMHASPLPIETLVFPDDALWFGAIVHLTKAGAKLEPASIEAHCDGDTLTVSTTGDLEVRLWLSPANEVVELYERDWRMLPLLQSPAATVWPGEMTHRVIHEAQQER